MEKHQLKVKKREEIGKKVRKLREKRLIPAVLYGHQVENRNLIVDESTFEKVYEKAGRSSIINLEIDKEEPVIALVQDIQRDPILQKTIHVDFRQIKAGEKLKTEVELKYIKESKAVKELDGVLVKNISRLEIECLPKDLIHEIDVDISSLNTFEDVIKIKDLKIPETIKVLEDLNEVVAKVQPPRKEEEIEALEEKPEEKVGEVEIAGKEGEAKEGEAEAKEGAEEEKKK